MTRRRLIIFKVLFKTVFVAAHSSVYALIAYALFDWPHAWWVAALAGPIVFPTFLIFAYLFGTYLYAGSLDPPVCRQGVCQFGDFTSEEAGGPVYRCRCGERYVRHRKKVFRLSDQGAASLYSVSRLFRGWKYVENDAGTHRNAD